MIKFVIFLSIFTKVGHAGSSSQSSRCTKDQLPKRVLNPKHMSIFTNVLSMVYNSKDKPYRGKESPKVDPSQCSTPTTPTCTDWCSENNDEQFCWKSETECWASDKTQCFAKKNSIVYDKDSDISWNFIAVGPIETLWGDKQYYRWAHFRHETTDLILLMSGNPRHPVDQLKSLEEDKFSVKTLVDSIPEDHKIILSGFSEGANWAIAINQYMRNNKKPQTIEMAIGGPPMVNKQFYDNLDPSLHTILVLGVKNANELINNGCHKPDVLYDFFGGEGLQYTHEHTWPPSIFITGDCSQACPDKHQQDLAKWMKCVKDSAANEMHQLSIYRDTLKKCWKGDL